MSAYYGLCTQHMTHVLGKADGLSLTCHIRHVCEVYYESQRRITCILTTSNVDGCSISCNGLHARSCIAFVGFVALSPISPTTLLLPRSSFSSFSLSLIVGDELVLVLGDAHPRNVPIFGTCAANGHLVHSRTTLGAPVAFSTLPCAFALSCFFGAVAVSPSVPIRFLPYLPRFVSVPRCRRWR